MLEELEKFFKVFDIQEDPSETAYFTGKVKPYLDDDRLFKLICLCTTVYDFPFYESNSKNELIQNIISASLMYYNLPNFKLGIQKIFNPWRF